MAESNRRKKRRVEKPPVSLQVGFYNIGWTDAHLSGKKIMMYREQLGKDCARAFQLNDLGMLCLCQVGDNKLDKNLDAHLGNNAGFQDKYRGQDVNRWLEQTIQQYDKSTALQAYVLGPYAIVLDSNVCRFKAFPQLTDPLVTVLDTNHTYRRAVRSVIQVLPYGPVIDVWVHHAPSSKARRYTPLARQQTMEYFFNRVSKKAIVGGHLNMSTHGIRSALRTWASRPGNSQEDWQIHVLPEASYGDLALTHGLKANQMELTGVGLPTIGTHELVVVQVEIEDLSPPKRPSLGSWSDARTSSVVRPAPRVSRVMEDSRARKFLATLDEAAHKRHNHPTQRALPQELLSSFWRNLLLGADEPDNLNEEQREILAIAKLDKLIELVATIRMAWINSSESWLGGARRRFDRARGVPERHLEELEGDLTEEELISCHNHYMNSLVWMTAERRAEYNLLKK